MRSTELACESEAASLAALLHLASPLLPVGYFSYSQGFEQAVHRAWVRNEAQALDWIKSHWTHWFAPLELGVLARCLRMPCSAWMDCDQSFLATRDARQSLEESLQVGSSLRRWLLGLDLAPHELEDPRAQQAFAWLRDYPQRPSAPVAFAACASTLGLDAPKACLAWGWSWLENQVQCAVRIIPIGQSSGQRLLRRLLPHTVAAARLTATTSETPGLTTTAPETPGLTTTAPATPGVTTTALETPGLTTTDRAARAEPPGSYSDEAAGFAPLAAVAAMRHERQYSRLYRS